MSHKHHKHRTHHSVTFGTSGSTHSTHSTHNTHPLLDGISSVIQANQANKRLEQARHDELIKKTQQIEDRERELNRKISNQTMNNQTMNNLIKVEQLLHDREVIFHRSEWERVKPSFMDKYDRFKLDIVNHVGDTNTLFIEINSLISYFDKHVREVTIEESILRQNLDEHRRIIKKRQEWENMKLDIDCKFQKIYKMKSYPDSELELIISTLITCSMSYTKYSEFLNCDEDTNFKKIKILLNNAQIQQHKYKLSIKRQEEKLDAENAEANIHKFLSEAQEFLNNFQYQSVFHYLRKASWESSRIKNLIDVSPELLGTIRNIDTSLQILSREMTAYDKRKEQQSIIYAEIIINDALVNSTLLERHYDRLKVSITKDLKRNWRKFDSADSEQMKLFNLTISQMITKELVPTTWLKRLGNWSNAELFILGSKVICPAISIMIDSWVSNIVKVHIDLPVFSNKFPVAEVSTTSCVYLPSATVVASAPPPWKP